MTVHQHLTWKASTKLVLRRAQVSADVARKMDENGNSNEATHITVSPYRRDVVPSAEDEDELTHVGMSTAYRLFVDNFDFDWLKIDGPVMVLSLICLITGGIIKGNDPPYAIENDPLHDWLYFYGIMGFVLTFCRLVNYIAFMSSRFVSSVYLSPFMLYVSGFDGPFVFIIWSLAGLVIWRLYLEYYVFVIQFFVVILLSAIVFGCKNTALYIIDTRVTRRQYHKRASDIIGAITALQLLSCVAAGRPNERFAAFQSTRNLAQFVETSGRGTPDENNYGSFAQLVQTIRRGKLYIMDKYGNLVQITSSTQLRRLAASLFKRLDRDSNGFLDEGLLESHLTLDEVKQVIYCMEFSTAQNISKQDFLVFVERTYNDWRSITRSMADLGGVARGLNFVFNTFFFILVAIIVIVVFKLDATALIVPLSSTIVGLSFALGTSLTRLVESLVLVIVRQPFNVGDRVVIDDGPQMFVHAIDVNDTTFRHLDNRLVVIPNDILSKARIQNYRKSNNAVIELVYTVDYRTTAKQLSALIAAVNHYVRDNQHCFRQDNDFFIYEAKVDKGLKVAFWVTHHMPWQEGKTVFCDRGKLDLFICDVLRKLGVAFVQPVQPVVLTNSAARPLQAPALPAAQPFFNEIARQESAMAESLRDVEVVLDEQEYDVDELYSSHRSVPLGSVFDYEYSGGVMHRRLESFAIPKRQAMWMEKQHRDTPDPDNTAREYKKQ